MHWKGHVFLFEKKNEPTYNRSAGNRLLLIFFLLEGIIGPRLSLFSWLHLTLPPAWLRIPVLLIFALLLIRYIAKIGLSQIGFIRWSEWSKTEKSYCLQVILIANVVFCSLFANHLQILLFAPTVSTWLTTTFFPNFIWGIYQEVVYRGILQTELVRRWGPLRGILVSTLFFTFGPLHFYHFASGYSALPMFAGIFAIGLFFALVFWRSGNLWMVAIFHGIGDSYIESTHTK